MVESWLPEIVLGFDFGTKHIGVAVGQTVSRTAKPLVTLKAEKGKPSWNQVQQLIQEWGAEALVVGIPLNMDGTEQKVTQQARGFVASLRDQFALPVYEIDERLTTVEAREHLFGREGYKALEKSQVDSYAAKLILEDWLQRQAS